MNLKSFNFLAVLLFVAFVVLVNLAKPPPEKPIPEDPDLIVLQMWEEESSPEDRHAILTGLTALECVDAGLCQLTHDALVRSPSE